MCLTTHREIHENFTNAVPLKQNLAQLRGLSYIGTARNDDSGSMRRTRAEPSNFPDIPPRVVCKVVNAQYELTSGPLRLEDLRANLSQK